MNVRFQEIKIQINFKAFFYCINTLLLLSLACRNSMPWLTLANARSRLFLADKGTINGSSQAKRCLRNSAKCTDSDSYRACAKFHPRICSPFMHSIRSTDSVCGQPRPWSDCANAQADLGLRCPCMHENTVSHGAAEIWYKWGKYCLIQLV